MSHSPTCVRHFCGGERIGEVDLIIWEMMVKLHRPDANTICFKTELAGSFDNFNNNIRSVHCFTIIVMEEGTRLPQTRMVCKLLHPILHIMTL